MRFIGGGSWKENGPVLPSRNQPQAWHPAGSSYLLIGPEAAGGIALTLRRRHRANSSPASFPPIPMLFRILNALMAALFLYSALLQFNDPDPLRWIVIYGIAAVPCLIAFVRGRVDYRFPALVGAVALVWSATHIPHVMAHGGVTHMFDQWKMTNEDVVYGREFFGLLIVAVWMLVLAAKNRRRTKVNN